MKKYYIIIAILVVLLVGLLAWGRSEFKNNQVDPEDRLFVEDEPDDEEDDVDDEQVVDDTPDEESDDVQDEDEVTAPPPQQNDDIVFEQGFYESCYALSEYELVFAKQTTTPREFLLNHSDAVAAINGVFYDTQGDVQGAVYSQKSGHLGNQEGRISGYFVIPNGAMGAYGADEFDNTFPKYEAVIGTHPMLVLDSSIHAQADEKQYNINTDGTRREFFRSAIGTKNARNVCFAVTTKIVTMHDWAKELVNQGYSAALNLDGGPVSQMSVQGGATYGLGASDTALVIYVTRK